MSPLVEVVNVTKVYQPYPWWMRLLARSSTRDSVTALDGVSLNVEAGSMCVVIGPNGAGKSTLFRILTGLTTSTSGEARVNGMDPGRRPIDVRRIVGFMPADDRTLYMRNTAVENLEFHGRLQGIARGQLKRRIDETLELVGLVEVSDRTVHALSSGMRARLQLARSLLHQPSVLILDEPTGAIDPMGAFMLLQSIVSITKERNLATLISSHRLEEIEALKDNVVLLDRGSVAFAGDLEQVRGEWQVPCYKLTFGSASMAERAAALIVASERVQSCVPEDNSVSVTWDVVPGQLLSVVAAHIEDLVSFEVSRLSLRDLLDSAINDVRARR